jgi:hypothetical protein
MTITTSREAERLGLTSTRQFRFISNVDDDLRESAKELREILFLVNSKLHFFVILLRELWCEAKKWKS